MGTETQQFATVIILFQIEHVKLNNPLMGTETRGLFRILLPSRLARSIKLNNPH